MNLHVNTDVNPDPEWSETEKAVRTVLFWHRFIPGFRELLIKDHESYFDPGKGIVQAVLKSLECIDPEKLLIEFPLTPSEIEDDRDNPRPPEED